MRKKVILVLDRYSAHRKAVRLLQEHHPNWIEVIWLPAYAPELNPVEMVWNHSQYGDLANFLPEGMDHLREAALPWHEWKRSLLYCFLASDIPDWSGDCYFEKAKINRLMPNST